MSPKSSHIAYLLDAESLLSIVTDRLREAARQAVRRKDMKSADAIGELQDKLSEASVIMYTLLSTLETPVPEQHLTDNGYTPIGYKWKSLREKVQQRLVEEDEDHEGDVEANRITIIPEE